MNKLFRLFLAALIFLAPVSTGQATLITLTSQVEWPGNIGNITNLPALGTTATLDAAGEYVAYVFVAREDMTISHVGFRSGTASGSPTMEARIEIVDAATGLPSGTLWAMNTNGTTGAISSNANTLQALTASATITKGQTFCVKILYASGTSLNIQILSTLQVWTSSSLPYQVLNTGTPTKAALSTGVSGIALGSSATTFYQVPGALPVSAAAASNFNNSGGARRGMLFTIPFNARIIGVRWYSANSVGDYSVCVFDSTGNELSNSCTAFEGDVSSASNGGALTNYFDNTVTVTAGTQYRVAVEPSSATNITFQTYTVPSTDYLSALPGGTAAQYTTYTSGGGWVDSTPTQVPLMDILIDQIDNGSGGGTPAAGRCIGC